ncbi:kinase domain-containing protein [Favolaschia claudopus]|uniref:Kinase domain-containing protein n=1 Tax=Favolaschia claudopus TaxID=2862362 RepID=A0AAW0ANE2_9AGAR
MTSVKKHYYEHEKFWVDMQPFLLSQGYLLRPRYQPNWIPTRVAKPSFFPQIYEDERAIFYDQVMDAARASDGRKVILKHIESDGNEMDIIKFLDSPPARKDPRNRTIPVLDIIPIPETSWSFLVMPYCREFNTPPFHCRNEFVAAMDQFLNGLQFMHDHNIAHFDIAPQNMMMDESRVVPRGSHFARPRTHTGFSDHMFYWNDRCAVSPVDCYFIDFGLSWYCPEGKDALVYGTLRTFRTIPELSDDVPYNPFPVDIFQLGLTIHKLIDTYPDLEDFRPVAVSMTVTNPKDRPSANDALAHFRQIAATMEPSKLSEQIWEKDLGRWKKLSRLMFGGWSG